MKTIKLKITNHPELRDDMRVYSSMVRMAFNRFQDGMKGNDIRKHLRKFFDVNCWLAMSAMMEARELFERFGSRKIVFGGKLNLVKRLRHKLTKDQFREGRLHAICSVGEANGKGNRLVSFDLPDGRLFYKPRRGTSVEIAFCKPKKKLMHELEAIQGLIDQKKVPVTIRLSGTEIYLAYDETLIHREAYKGLKQSRILGIDMNPNYIGASVIEFDKGNTFKVLHKEVFDLTALTKLSGESSQHKKSKYFTSKLKHETLAIAHRIDKLVDYWKCSKLAIEDLSIKPTDRQKGKIFNRLCNNKWERQLLVNKFKMLAGIHRYELVEVNPIYSSIVGNFAYGNPNTPDMVAASIEIARRAYKKV